MEVLLKQESESNKADEKEVAELKELGVPDLIATLNGIKIEEQELLREREHLQTTESELRKQAIMQIGEKKRALKGLKTEISFLQNKCSELDQALGITDCK